MGWLANYRKRNTESREKIIRAVTFGEPTKGKTVTGPTPPVPPRPPRPPRPPKPPALRVGLSADVSKLHDDMQKMMDDVGATMDKAFQSVGMGLVGTSSDISWTSTTVRVTVGDQTIELDDPYRCDYCNAYQPLVDGVFLLGGRPVCQKCHEDGPSHALGEKQAQQEPLIPAEQIVDDLTKLRDELT